MSWNNIQRTNNAVNDAARKLGPYEGAFDAWLNHMNGSNIVQQDVDVAYQIADVLNQMGYTSGAYELAHSLEAKLQDQSWNNNGNTWGYAYGNGNSNNVGWQANNTTYNDYLGGYYGGNAGNGGYYSNFNNGHMSDGEKIAVGVTSALALVSQLLAN